MRDGEYESRRPIDLVRGRVPDARGSAARFRTRCPACGSRSQALSVKEDAAGNALLHCFRGCELAAVVAALGLAMRDLFAGDRAARPQTHRVRGTTPAAVRDALIVETKRVQARVLADCGYARPLRTAEVRAVRDRVGTILGVAFPRVEAPLWECPPHDADASWPALFNRALDEAKYERHHRRNPDAPAWTTSTVTTRGDIHVARVRAAKWLRAMASEVSA